MKRLRTFFMGTPDFAVPCLKRLVEISDVVGVATQPDKKRGRGQKVTPSPVKIFAQERCLSVYQPERIRNEEFVAQLDALSPDLIVVVAFGQILPPHILELPALGCINVHASLLPRYRGAAPMQRCLMAGETRTGVTTMFMDKGLDTGDILLQEEIEIGPDMTFEMLHDTLREMGADLLEKTMEALTEGLLIRTKQDDSSSSYAAILTKDTGKIDWKKSAVELHNLVRALDSWPGAYTVMNGQTFKIWRTRVVSEDYRGIPGEVVHQTKQGLAVATGAGLLEILELQAPGKKRMLTTDYLRGHAVSDHSCFA